MNASATPTKRGKEKNRAMMWTIIVIALVFAISFFGLMRRRSNPAGDNGRQKLKLVWLVPDGFRADPEVFRLFEWAQEGVLPHIGQMLKEGTLFAPRDGFLKKT